MWLLLVAVATVVGWLLMMLTIWSLLYDGLPSRERGGGVGNP